MNIKLHDLICRIISYLMIAVLSLLTFFSVISTTFVNSFDQVYYIGDKAWLHVIGIIVILAIVCILHKKLHFKVTDKVLILSLALMAILIGIYIAIAGMPPRFDQRVVRSIAANLIVGIYDDFLPGGYGAIYPNNHGIILFYYLLMKFTGYEDYIAMQYANLLFMVLTEIAFYFILKRITAYYREASLGLILFMPFWGYATFLYGNIPGFCFGVWALLFCLRFFEKHRIIDVLAAGILMSIGYRFKENLIILAAAIAIMTIARVIKTRRAKSLLLILSMLIFMLISGFISDKLLLSVAGYRKADSMPSISFLAMGLHEHETRGAGWYDDYTMDVFEEAGYDTEKASELSKSDIADSVSNFVAHPQYMTGFFIRKTASVWGEPTYYSWSLQQGRNDKLDEEVFLPDTASVIGFANVLQTFLYFFALVYFVIHRKEQDITRLLFAIFFIGGFLFHLIWEAGSQYALFYAMVLTVYSSIGLIDACSLVMYWDRKKRLRAVVIAMVIGIVLSMPIISSVLTLSRDNVRYAEYINAPY